MNSRQIAQSRLNTQRITHAWAQGPAEFVQHMGCIQSQDFAGAKWALGARMPGLTETEVEACFNEGSILRTHVLRPTWHFVSPKDIGWMLALTGPRVQAFCKNIHRRLGIADRTLRRSKDILVGALEGGKFMPRTHLETLFKKARINTDDIRLPFHLMDAELEGLICSGPRQGKQLTYALLEERINGVVPLIPDDPLKELALRYFLGRGPAMVRDFAWWGGLTLTAARKGVEAAAPYLSHVVVRGEAYWFPKDMQVEPGVKGRVHLLPAYDEYTVSYRDRSDVLKKEHIAPTGSGISKPTLIVNGAVVGTWRRIDKKEGVLLEVQPLVPLTAGASKLLETAAAEYGRFLQKPVRLSKKRVS